MKSHIHLALASLISIGFGSTQAVYAQEQSVLGEWTDSLIAELCISDERVPELLDETDAKLWAQDKGILCLPVVDEENPPAPGGMAVYDATGQYDRSQAESELVEELQEEPLFDFDSLLPAPRLSNTDDEEEFRTDFGMRDPILDEPIRYDPTLSDEVAEFDFDAQMAAHRNAPDSSSPTDPSELDFEAQLAATRSGESTTDLGDPFGEAGREIQSGPVELGNVYEARRQIALQAARDSFRAQNSQIQNQCECVYNSLSCFSEPNYDYSQLNDNLAIADADFEFQKDKVCKDYNDWATRVSVDQIEDIDQMNALVGTTNTVISNLSSLSRSHNNVLDDLRNAESQIAADIRRQEQARQAAIAAQQQSSGSSGWGIAGLLLEQAGVQTGDFYSELAGNLIQDIASGGSASNTGSMMQDYGYGSYDLDTPDYASYGGYDSPNPAPAYDYAIESAMDQVNVFEPQQPSYSQPSSQQSSSESVNSSADLFSPEGCESEGWTWLGNFGSCALIPSGSVSTSASIQKCQAFGGSWQTSPSPVCNTD